LESQYLKASFTLAPDCLMLPLARSTRPYRAHPVTPYSAADELFIPFVFGDHRPRLRAGSFDRGWAATRSVARCSSVVDSAKNGRAADFWAGGSTPHRSSPLNCSPVTR
jgi:hypothetical protein